MTVLKEPWPDAEPGRKTKFYMTTATDCHACHLRAGCRQVVHGEGPLDALIAVVGEAPGMVEDDVGRPFAGPSGRVVDTLIRSIPLERDKMWITNVFHCRPPGNDISAAEGSPCPHLWLAAELRALSKLKVIVALGRTALGHFRPGSERELVRDHARRDTRWPDPVSGGIMVIGSYHPSAALRGNRLAEEAIVDAFRRAARYAG